MPDNNSKKQHIESFYDDFHTQKARGPARIMLWSRFHILKKIIKKTSGNILVVGCGSQKEMSILPSSAEGYGIDISKRAVEYARKEFPRYDIRVADASHLPFGDSFFTTIVCSEVIEHVENADEAMSEFARALEPKGTLVLTTPNWWSWYGIFRLFGELIMRKPLTSDNQPIDHWSTPHAMRKKIQQHFTVEKFRGFWYYLPFGKGHIQIPSVCTIPIVVILWPIELLLRILLPWFGHSMIFVCKKK
ncbi:class I SAM-dependent methyltransferase [Patescibacteria group bacterium]